MMMSCDGDQTPPRTIRELEEEDGDLPLINIGRAEADEVAGLQKPAEEDAADGDNNDMAPMGIGAPDVEVAGPSIQDPGHRLNVVKVASRPRKSTAGQLNEWIQAKLNKLEDGNEGTTVDHDFAFLFSLSPHPSPAMGATYGA